MVQETQLQQKDDQTFITLQLKKLDLIFHALAIQCESEKTT
jgi:hypothetical protein